MSPLHAKFPLISPFLFSSLVYLTATLVVSRLGTLPNPFQMYLHLSPLSPFHSPSEKPPSPPNSKACSLLIHTFEGSLLCHLKSLLAPLPSATSGARPAVSFSFLSRAAGVLSSIHADAGALFSDSSLSGSDEAALSSYISSSIQLLDVCNALSAEIERLHLGRLLLLFVVHLLSTEMPPPPEKIRKARESIREWEASSPTPSCGLIGAAAACLIRDLDPRHAPPNGKATVLGRAVYAVEAVSALVAGVLVSLLGGELEPATGPKVPPEYPWAEAFTKLKTALSGAFCTSSSSTEMETMKASVGPLAKVMDDTADEGDSAERWWSAVKEVESATEEFTEGLDRLRGAVNDLFHAVMWTRNTALQSFRPGVKKCK